MKVIQFTISLLFYFFSYGQQKYWVYFCDKTDTTGLPSGFNEYAIQRRIVQNIPWQASDYPINNEYIREVECKSDSIGYASRWLNALAAWIHPDSLDRIKALPFVKKVELIESYSNPIVLTKDLMKENQRDKIKKLAEKQISELGAPLLRTYNLDGKGIRICIIDAGFLGAKDSPGLSHVYQRKGVASTFDFIRKQEDVYAGSAHGTYVFSCLAGKTETLQTGLATGATYLLARTESVWSENLVEEDRWIAALEWADQQGAHIINCSMGYSRPKYKISDLNGQSRLSQAMNMAANKEILVINAAGNEFNNSWKTIIIPADAEKVLTVGAIDTYTGEHAWFSSVGPTADKRVKPELTAPGTVVAWGKNKTHVISGTSFSAPLISGLAACIWQHFTDTLTGTMLKQRLIKSGCWWPFYDYRLGYGIPVTEVILTNQQTNINWNAITDSTQLTIRFSEPLTKNEKIYYKVEKQPGVFELYGFLEMKKGDSINSIPWNLLGKTRNGKTKGVEKFSGKTLWLKWRDEQKEIKIP